MIGGVMTELLADKPRDEKCSIEGRVVDGVTGEGVKRVALTLTLSGGESRHAGE